MPQGRRPALLWPFVIALPALVLAAKMPSRPHILAVLNDAAHAPVFAAFAVVILMLLHRRVPSLTRRYATSFLIAVAIGGAIELVQPFIGRGAQWSDLLNDVLGAAAGLALAACFNLHGSARPLRGPQRLILLLLALAAMAPVGWPVVEAAIAYGLRSSRLPVLFENRMFADRYFIRGRGAVVETEMLPAAWQRAGDAASLRIRFAGGRWPGVAHSEPAADWRGYTRVMLDLTNPDAEPLALTIRVHDRQHDNRATDRFNRALLLPGGARQVFAIPLADVAAGPVARTLDLSQVDGLIVFGDGERLLPGRSFYLTRIWLE